MADAARPSARELGYFAYSINNRPDRESSNLVRFLAVKSCTHSPFTLIRLMTTHYVSMNRMNWLNLIYFI